MDTEKKFMNFENLNRLIEEHKKETHHYKRYEFDSTSYTLLLIDINNLLEENQELKQKYLNAVSDYETAMAEKNELNSLVNSCQEEIRQLKKQLTTYQILHRDCNIDNLKNISKIEEKETQQKEFIDYMNKTIEELECDDVDDEEMKGYLIQRIDTFKEIFSKYKKIIGDDDCE